MTSPLRNFLTAVFVLTCLLTQYSCGKSNDESPTSQVMMVHAQPEGSNLSVEFDNDFLAQNVGYNQHSTYASVPSGKQLLFMVNELPSDSNILIAQVKTFSSGKYYSMLLVPDADYTLAAVIFTDTIARTDTGAVTLRFIHASPNAGEINIHVAGITSDTTLTQGEFDPSNPSGMSAWLSDLEAGVYQFTFLNSLSADTLYVLNNIPLEAGGSYSIILSGYVPTEGTELPPLSSQIISHRL